MLASYHTVGITQARFLLKFKLVKHKRENLRRRVRSITGFTLFETMIALGVVTITVATSVAGLLLMNRAAHMSRLQTAALALAQQRIDEILTTNWDPMTRPAILSSAIESNLPLNDDAFANSSTLADPAAPSTDKGLRSMFTDLDLRINAQRETTIQDIATSATVLQVRAAVTVTYSYRDRNYSVSLTTLRASDSF